MCKFDQIKYVHSTERVSFKQARWFAHHRIHQILFFDNSMFFFSRGSCNRNLCLHWKCPICRVSLRGNRTRFLCRNNKYKNRFVSTQKRENWMKIHGISTIIFNLINEFPFCFTFCSPKQCKKDFFFAISEQNKRYGSSRAPGRIRTRSQQIIDLWMIRQEIARLEKVEAELKAKLDALVERVPNRCYPAKWTNIVFHFPKVFGKARCAVAIFIIYGITSRMKKKYIL